MMDPSLEQLHQRAQSVRFRMNLGRAAVLQCAVVSLMVLTLLTLLRWQPVGHWAPTWEVVSLVLAAAATSRVRFSVGAAATCPVVIFQIPLWFAVPPAWLPMVIGVSFVLGELVAGRFAKPRPSPWRSLLIFDSAFYAIGPALVLTFAGAPEPTASALPVIALAFVAQATLDVGAVLAYTKFVLRVPMTTPLRPALWVTIVDTALAPIGVMVAILMEREPAAMLAALPLVALFAEFARERAERIEQAMELSSSYRGTAQLMGDVLEADDAYTGGEHTRGVVDMAVAVGRSLRLDPRDMRDLEFGALLHDVGKLRVPNEIINKPGKLTEPEWAMVREHPVYGQQMLDRVGGALTDAGRIVRAHHERWDGNGYPDKLKGEDIPVASRIITACDSFSAMTTTRSYREAMTEDQALAELDRCAGTQFDPEIVEVLREEVLRARVDRTFVPSGDTTALAAVLAAEREARGGDDALGLIAQ